jgi:hypothetical protein
MKKSVYYLPGRGGRLHEGLGKALLARGVDVVGREMRGAFAELSFAQQVSTIAEDLQERHWGRDAIVIANSFGAYLFLHAQAAMTPYAGRVLLLSPIVGEALNHAQAVGFVPPYARKLHELAAAGQYPALIRCQIHVGSEDWQSVPENVKELGRLLNIPVHIVPNNGHMLDKGYVSGLIDSWIQDSNE